MHRVETVTIKGSENLTEPSWLIEISVPGMGEGDIDTVVRK
jgi:hypothetical protein